LGEKHHRAAAVWLPIPYNALLLIRAEEYTFDIIGENEAE
jgi:hypothetical protein